MNTQENLQISQGSALVIAGTVYDALGNVVTTYTGSEALVTTVWPGGKRPASFNPVTTWSTPSAGTFTIAITAADTIGLASGRYQLLTRVQPSGQDPVDAYGCTLDVLAFAGTETTPTSYCSYADLLKYGRAWLRQLQTDDDEAGFATQLGRARSWIEDLAHAHFRVAAMTMVVGNQAFGPRRSGAARPGFRTSSMTTR